MVTLLLKNLFFLFVLLFIPLEPLLFIAITDNTNVNIMSNVHKEDNIDKHV